MLHLARLCVSEVLAHPAVILVYQPRSPAQLKAVLDTIEAKACPGKEGRCWPERPRGLPSRPAPGSSTLLQIDHDHIHNRLRQLPASLTRRQSQAADLSAEREKLPCLLRSPDVRSLCCYRGLSPQPLQRLHSTQGGKTTATQCAADLLQHACALDAVKPLLPLGCTVSTSGPSAKHRLPGDLRCQTLNRVSAERMEASNSPPAAVPSQGTKSGESRTGAGQSQQPAVELVRQSAVRFLLCVLQPYCV